ncbi:unnamed protein product [Ectocarpus sp. 13 AM-2016]
MIKEFECTPDGQQDLQEKVLAVAPAAETDPIIMFARTEKVFSDQICGDKTIAPKIKHLSWMFNTYVADSRRRYDEELSRAFAYSPGDDKECRTKRGVFMEKELGENNVHPPPKHAAVLPICSTRSVFIHIDMKTLKYWGLLSSNDAWWFSDVLRPFSREANVKCLRSDENSKYASNQQGYLSSLLRSGPNKCPWMVGESFLTDGVQIKLLLLTLEHTRKAFPGSSELNEAGYNKLRRPDAPLENPLNEGRGVYNISTVTAANNVRSDVVVMSADPGRAKVINVSSATAEVWARKDPRHILSTSTCVLGDDYRRDTLASRSDKYESFRRRSSPYGDAIHSLGNEKKRTSCLDTFVRYCKSWCSNGPALFSETLRKARKLFRFGRHRATQRTLAKIADKYIGKMGEACRVMLFGKASFRAQKGRASAPRKAMIREMASRGVVLMVNEYNTSKKCPGCFGDTIEDKERRTRSCTNKLHSREPGRIL